METAEPETVVMETARREAGGWTATPHPPRRTDHTPRHTPGGQHRREYSDNYSVPSFLLIYALYYSTKLSPAVTFERQEEPVKPSTPTLLATHNFQGEQLELSELSLPYPDTGHVAVLSTARVQQMKQAKLLMMLGNHHMSGEVKRGRPQSPAGGRQGCPIRPA